MRNQTRPRLAATCSCRSPVTGVCHGSTRIHRRDCDEDRREGPTHPRLTVPTTPTAPRARYVRRCPYPIGGSSPALSRIRCRSSADAASMSGCGVLESFRVIASNSAYARSWRCANAFADRFFVTDVRVLAPVGRIQRTSATTCPRRSPFSKTARRRPGKYRAGTSCRLSVYLTVGLVWNRQRVSPAISVGGSPRHQNETDRSWSGGLSSPIRFSFRSCSLHHWARRSQHLRSGESVEPLARTERLECVLQSESRTSTGQPVETFDPYRVSPATRLRRRRRFER